MCRCVWYGMFYSCLWPVSDLNLNKNKKKKKDSTDRTGLCDNARSVHRPLVRALVFMLSFFLSSQSDCRRLKPQFHMWNPRELLVYSLAWTLSLFSPLLFFLPLPPPFAFCLACPGACRYLTASAGIHKPRTSAALWKRKPIILESAFHRPLKAADAGRASCETEDPFWAGQPVVRQERSLWRTQVLGCPLACQSVNMAAPAGHLYNCNFTQGKTKPGCTGGNIKGDYPGVCFPGKEFGECCWVPSPEGQSLTGNIITLHLQRPRLSGGATDARNTWMWHLTLMTNAAGTLQRWPLTLRKSLGFSVGGWEFGIFGVFGSL